MKNLSVLDNVVQKDGTLLPLGDMTPPVPEQEVEFRVNPEDPTKAQYKTKDGDEWQDFSSGGGVATLITTLTQGNIYAWDNINVNSAGYTHLLIECCFNDSWINPSICLVQKNVPTPICCFRDGGVYYRYVKVTDTQIMGQGFLTDSYRCIPHRVWGVNIEYK